MKRTGIFAAAAAGAIGATALVGGVGYTLALDVAEQTGEPLDLGAVASVKPGERDIAESSGTDEATEDAGDATSDEAPPADVPDGGAAPDPGAGGAAPVAPAAPVVIDPGAGQPAAPPPAPPRSEPRFGGGYGDGDRDGWDGDRDGWSGGGDGWSGGGDRDGGGWSGGGRDGGYGGGYGGHDGGHGGHH